MSLCRRCQSPLEVTTRDAAYPGLPGVVVAGVQMVSCTGCDYRATRYPAAVNMDRVIARQIANGPALLRPERLRFLRTVLLLSGKEFAQRIGVDPATVSRWENGKQPHPLAVDQLLRAWVRAMPDDASDIGEWLPEVRAEMEAEPDSIVVQPSAWAAVA